MSERSTLRLVVLGVLLASMLATLVARLFYLQIVAGDTYRSAATSNSNREIVTPAVRGLILDQTGRPIVANKSTLVVSVDRVLLKRQPDAGAPIIAKLAKVLDTTEQKVNDRLATCGEEGAPKPPVCWNGSPYQPVPVATNVSTEAALEIMERQTEFPGVTAEVSFVRDYPAPNNMNAAHILGYLGPVTEEQLNAQPDPKAPDRLRRNDLVGRSGLEAEYDAQLRGKPGVKTVSVDTAGRVTGTVDDVAPTPGKYVVTNIDSKLQAVVEEQLIAAINRAHEQGFVGDTGAAVVVDVRNGHVLAMASYPSYDPSVWVGGVTKSQFQELMDSKALSSNAMQGLFAPGSTFKVISTAAAGKEGFDLNGTYQCPNKLKLGTLTFRNFESAGYGKISLARALEVSCNTVFYGIADKMWKDAGGFESTVDSPDPIATTAKIFGLGTQSGIDLPNEATGRVSSRAFKQANWEARKDAWCANAVGGYPETRKTNPKLADFYTALDKENCADGFRWREGDALNAAIGQGDTAVTPLQMAMVYATIANGGKLYAPQIAKAIVDASGNVVEEIQPKLRAQVDVPASTMKFLEAALPGVTTRGSGATPFAGFPLAQIPVASKTGSAQVTGNKASTSWFASYAPANKPKYAVVMMVTQGGTGSGTSGPSVRKIYEALFGVSGSSVNPARSVLLGGAPQDTLPVIREDGTPVTPKEKNQ